MHGRLIAVSLALLTLASAPLHDLRTVRFQKHTAVLSAADRNMLKQFAATVSTDARLDKVIVAAWGDHQSLQAETKDSAVRDSDLAQSRGDAVAAALKADGIKRVTVYNMDQSPSWWATEFGAPSALVKGTTTGGENPSANQAVLAEIGDQVRTQGGQGTAVVIAKWRGEVVSH